MSWLSDLRHRLGTLLFRSTREAELAEELRDHLAREAEARIRAGATPEAAGRAAAIAFGGTTRFAEATRDAWGWRWLDDLAIDLRHAARLLRRYPSFACATIGIAALGIGATTVVFSAVYGVMMRPLPIPNASRLAAVKLSAGKGTYPGISPESFRTIAGQSALVSAAGMYSSGRVVLLDRATPEYSRVEYLTPPLLAMLRVPPHKGRLFTEEDAARDEPVVILSYESWQRQFAGTEDILGKRIQLDGAISTVIGVMPQEFRGPRHQAVSFWLPARYEAGGLVSAGKRVRGGMAFIELAPGLSLEQAQSRLNQRLRIPAVDVISGDSVIAEVELTSLRNLVLLDGDTPLLILFGAVCLVLILVATNVATLGLARASVRVHEMSVRQALGAGRGRRIRQALTETLVLTLIGGLVGLILAQMGLALFVRASLDILPRPDDIRLDLPVLAFALGVTLLTGLATGLVPALFRPEGEIAGAMAGGSTRGGDRRGGIARAVLVTAEVAISIVLLVGAGLLLKGFLRVVPSAPGFALEHRIDLDLTHGLRSEPDTLDHRAFIRETSRLMREIPTVRDVAVSSMLPLVRTAALVPVVPEGASTDSKLRGYHFSVTPNYFRLMEIPLVAGREFTDADTRSSALVAIVSQTAASRWWPNESALGKTVLYTFSGKPPQRVEVVGISADTRANGLDLRSNPELFVPFDQFPVAVMHFVVHATGPSGVVAAALKEKVWIVSPRNPVDDVTTLMDIASDSVKYARFYAVLVTIFAITAMLIAAAGLFSVLAYTVSQRKREIGIRLAIGASQRSVALLVMRQGLILASIGFAAGVGISLGVTRYMSSLLLGVAPTDAGVFLMASAVLLVVAVVACLLPARRALRVDPVVSLRGE